eukprot:GHUV01009118.1.p1 GENE.GHUV01009118.1~~GHUV01009118.1.p1  ORF type:complete len:271 (+),score=42.88 GHUV01009118.1:832-1644(+)
MDPAGIHISSVSAALEHDGKLFLGNLAGDYVSYVDLQAQKHRRTASSSTEGAESSEKKRPGFIAFADAGVIDEKDWESCSADGPHGSCTHGGDDAEDADESDGDDEVLAEVDPIEDGEEDAEVDDDSVDEHEAQATGCSSCSSKPRPMPEEDRAMLYIHGKVYNNKVVIFSKSYCPFCRKAKRALSTFLKPEQYVVVELDQLHELPEDDEARTIPEGVFQDALERITGKRTVPRVFIGNKFVGGGDDMDSMAQTGRLKTVLREQGLIDAE